MRLKTQDLLTEAACPCYDQNKEAVLAKNTLEEKT
jgi:hypothetical protein